MKVKLTLCKPFINVKHTKITVSCWQVCKPNINDFFLHENTCLFDNKSEFRLQLFPHGLNHWDQTISQLLYCLKESIRSEKLAIITHKVKKWQINTEVMTDLNFALKTFLILCLRITISHDLYTKSELCHQRLGGISCESSLKPFCHLSRQETTSK